MEKLEFTLIRATQEVVIDDAPYVLMELDGAARDRYLNGLNGRLRVDNNGKPGGLKNFDGLQASLVAASLYKVVGDDYEPVKLATVQTWPASMVTSLFKAAQVLSGLEDDGKGEVEGND